MKSVKLLVLLTLFAATPALWAVQTNAQNGCDEEFGQNYWNQHPTARAQEESTAVAAGGKLALRPPRNGGVAVEGWDRDVISVVACKTAGGDTAAEAQQVLSGIRIKTEAGLVTAEGPAGGEWTV